MPLTPYLAKALLDWANNVGSPTQPVGRFIGFASGSPDTANDSACPAFRNTVTFQAASNAVGSASASLKAVVSCSGSGLSTAFGWNLYDATSAGNRLMYGTLTASQTFRIGSNLAFTAPNLKIVLVQTMANASVAGGTIITSGQIADTSGLFMALAASASLASGGNLVTPVQFLSTIVTDPIQSGLPADWTQETGTFTARIVADATTHYTDRILNTSADSVSGDISWNPPGLNFDQEILTLTQITGPVINGTFYLLGIVRAQPAVLAGYVIAFVANSTSGGIVYNLGVYPSASIIGSDGSLTWSVGQWYWARLRISGDQVQGKVWALGTAEPGAFAITGNDPTWASGKAGARLQVAGTNVAYFSAAIGGLSAPGPGLSATAALAASGTLRATPRMTMQIGAALVAASTLITFPVYSVLSPSGYPKPPYHSFVGKVSSGVTAWQATAALPGIGALIATPRQTMQVSSALPGAGSLIATPIQTMQVRSTLPGSGSLAATPFFGLTANATLAGNGSLIATPFFGLTANATLAGAGTLTATPSLALTANATLPGQGFLSATPFSALTANATLAGNSTLTATPFFGLTANATLAGQGFLKATPIQTMQVSSVLPGVGFLNAVAAGSLQGAATLAGAGSLIATPIQTMQVSSTLPGVGSLNAVPFSGLTANATLASNGNLIASPFFGLTANTTLAGQGFLNATPFSALTANATLAGQGFLNTTPFSGLTANATLAASSTLFANGVISNQTTAWQATATLVGAGSLIATPEQTMQASAKLAGNGLFSAVALARQIVSVLGPGGYPKAPYVAPATPDRIVSVLGPGGYPKEPYGAFVKAASAQALQATATLAGAGALIAAPLQTMQVSAALPGVGFLNAAPRQTMQVSETLPGAGALIATTLQTMQVRSTLPGVGFLFGDPQIVHGGSVAWQVTAILAGQGFLNATPFSALIATATLAGQGFLSATPFSALTATATLAGVGFLNAQPFSALTTTATLAGQGFLSAVSFLGLTANALLAGQGFLKATPFSALAAKAMLAGQGFLNATPSMAMLISAVLPGVGFLAANGIVVPAAGTGVIPHNLPFLVTFGKIKSF